MHHFPHTKLPKLLQPKAHTYQKLTVSKYDMYIFNNFYIKQTLFSEECEDSKFGFLCFELSSENVYRLKIGPLIERYVWSTCCTKHHITFSFKSTSLFQRNWFLLHIGQSKMATKMVGANCVVNIQFHQQKNTYVEKKLFCCKGLKKNVQLQ